MDILKTVAHKKNPKKQNKKIQNFICHICQKIFLFKSRLESLLLTHNKMEKLCPKYYKTFKRSDHFETHIIKCNKFVPTFIEPLAADNNDPILNSLARGYHVPNTDKNNNSKNDSSFRFRQHKRRTLFKIDNILQIVELQQKENIISSVIQKSNLESTIVNFNVRSVFEGKVVNSLIEYFKTLANSKQYSTL